jgi:hypothetical protein
MTIEVIGPDGAVVPFEVQGQAQPQTSLTLTPPFKGGVLVRRPPIGTYTIRTSSEAENPKASKSTCQATVMIDPSVGAVGDVPRWFAQGAFGKQRRNYEYDVPGISAPVLAGFCDPMLGFSVGPLFWFNENRVSLAPTAGVAFMFGDFNDDQDFGDGYNNASFFLEAVANFHFSPGGAFVGTGLGWWDVFDGDHNTGNWIINFGVPVSEDKRWLIVGEGRLFFDSPDGIDNNYQMWGGVRYLFR